MAFSSGLSLVFPHYSLKTHLKSPKTKTSRVSYICRATTQNRGIIDSNFSSDPSKLQPNLIGRTTFHPKKLSADYERKIEDVRKLLQSIAENDPTESLILVDAIQRAGVNSYFQKEIETVLQQFYDTTNNRIYGFHTLHDVSLLFRLLRQHGYYISADIFSNFKGKDGRFQGKLRQDMRGLMELYEAAQLSFEGEYILDEAAMFSRQILQESVAADHVGYNCSEMITDTLRHPYHKSIPRLTRKNVLQDFEWGKTLEELAVMDLNKAQSIYQAELLQISEWWKDLGLAKSLKHARNQPVKWYMWSMASLIDDISMSAQRIELTKSISFIYLIDDIFDLYGTIDELTIFTEAIKKWDYAAMDTLPYYQKMCYKALLDMTNEIAHKIYRKHGFNPIDSLKTAWASLCDAFLVEAKWFASGDLPTADTYLKNGKVSSGIGVVLVHLFFLLGLGGGTIHLKDTSQLISSIATILRLWDDLGSAKDEDQDGEDGSYTECYRKDNEGLSIAEAREHVIDMIENEWKSLNTECFRVNQYLAPSFRRASLNLARMVSVMYSYDDNQRLPVLEEYVKFMLSN